MDFVLKLSEGKDRLEIELPERQLSLTAIQVEEAIAELAAQRLRMLPPETPLPRQGAPIQVRTDPPWLLAPNAGGGATLSFYYQGIGWIHLEYSIAELGELEKAIVRARNQPAAGTVQ